MPFSEKLHLLVIIIIIIIIIIIAHMDVLPKNIDIDELLEPLERAINDALIPSITGHTCTTSERELLALPVRKGELGLENPVR